MLTIEIYQQQIRKLREENEELREENRQLREREAKVSILPPGLPHLTRLEERAFTAIWSRRGIVDKLTIYNDMYDNDSSVDLKIVDVMVHKLRRKFAAPGLPRIVTLWGRGYAIDRGGPIESPAAVRGEMAQMIGDWAA